MDLLVVFGFHPFEMFALEVGQNLRELNLENVEVLRFTPKSVGENYRSYEDWFELSVQEQIKKSEEGRRELKSYIKEMYGRPGFIIELHDDPAKRRLTRFTFFFPAWNVKLRRVLEEFTKNMKRYGHFGDVYPSYPVRRVSYHSATLEYFPFVEIGLTKGEGIFIAKELIRYLKRNYLSGP